MSTLYPLIFQPRFKERVWGGRTLETLYGKRLPPGVPIGESWEISDRPGDESVVINGPLGHAAIAHRDIAQIARPLLDLRLVRLEPERLLHDVERVLAGDRLQQRDFGFAGVLVERTIL